MSSVLPKASSQHLPSSANEEVIAKISGGKDVFPSDSPFLLPAPFFSFASCKGKRLLRLLITLGVLFCLSHQGSGFIADRNSSIISRIVIRAAVSLQSLASGSCGFCWGFFVFFGFCFFFFFFNDVVLFTGLTSGRQDLTSSNQPLMKREGLTACDRSSLCNPGPARQVLS